MVRFRVRMVALIALLLAAGAVPLDAAGSKIPKKLTVYNCVLTGDTYDGYYPFQREAVLVVEPRIRSAGGVNFRNGANPRDVGLFTGNPPSSPDYGAIWFATNTRIFDQAGITLGNGLSSIDVAYVKANEGRGLLGVQVDGRMWGLPAARTSVLNCFTATSGLAADIYQVVQGTMVLQFRSGGRQVQGEINFVGNGYIEPAQVSYHATLEGERTRN